MSKTLHSVVDRMQQKTTEFYQHLQEDSQDATLILKEIIELDKELHEILQNVKEHQDIYSRVEEKKKKLAKIIAEKQQEIKSLFDFIQNLDKTISTGQSIIEMKNSMHSIQSDTLLSYAQRVAKHTLSSTEPPIPQDSQMRMSMLYQQDDQVLVKKKEDANDATPMMDLDALQSFNENNNEEAEEELLDLF